MAITVVCVKCRTRFSVDEKFAGRTGPCPKCKAPIRIPTKAEEVKIFGGEDFATGGRDAAGKLVLKPIARTETRFQPVQAAAIAGAVLVAFVLAWLTGGALAKSLLACGVALLLISPPLVVAAYAFLRDDEKEPYQGKELLVRAAACAVGFIILWGVLSYLTGTVLTGELWQWLFVLPPLVAFGGALPTLSLDLDYGDGVFHYIFYLLVTLALRWTAGMPWPWD
ncbi:MAG: hypothetical protein U1E05_21335 [Patescibacteria group bacterium]|nr:hypothetical protein [Patescibacteria group bacterium]